MRKEIRDLLCLVAGDSLVLATRCIIISASILCTTKALMWMFE